MGLLALCTPFNTTQEPCQLNFTTISTFALSKATQEWKRFFFSTRRHTSSLVMQIYSLETMYAMLLSYIYLFRKF
jgi:hypothetical protein